MNHRCFPVNVLSNPSALSEITRQHSPALRPRDKRGNIPYQRQAFRDRVPHSRDFSREISAALREWPSVRHSLLVAGAAAWKMAGAPQRTPLFHASPGKRCRGEARIWQPTNLTGGRAGNGVIVSRSRSPEIARFLRALGRVSHHCSAGC